MGALLPRILADASRWGLLAALFFAPWAFGSTRPWAIEWLCQWLAVVLALRLAGLALPRGRYQGNAPRILLGAIFVIVVLGWVMTWNARGLIDPDFATFAPLNRPFASWPGAADAALALSWMIRLTLMLGVLLLVVEIARDPKWRMRLWVTIVAAGGTVAALGVLQRAGNAPTILWENPAMRGVDESYSKNFFATFYYHANAGAFLNLCLPATFALLMKAIARPTKPLVLALIVANCVVSALAVVMNTSRAAQIIAALLLVALVIWPGRKVLSFAWKKQRGSVLVGGIVAGVALLAVVGGVGLERQFERWRETTTQAEKGKLLETRILAQQAAVSGLKDALFCGVGPGCFQAMFPFYTAYLGDRIAGFWRFLHADYVQTVFEWGVIGATAWSVIFFGGLLRGWRRERELQAERSSHNLFFLPACVLGLLGVALHALIDFPLQIASIQLYVVVLLGLCWGWGDVARSSRRRRPAENSEGDVRIA